MNKTTGKQAKLDKSYAKVRRKKIDAMIERYGYVFCQGCGTNQQPIDCSHRIPRSQRPGLTADPKNLDLYCRNRCHKAVEAGQYDKLLNGDEVKKYIKATDLEYYNLKVLKPYDVVVTIYAESQENAESMVNEYFLTF